MSPSNIIDIDGMDDSSTPPTQPHAGTMLSGQGLATAGEVTSKADGQNLQGPNVQLKIPSHGSELDYIVDALAPTGLWFFGYQVVVVNFHVMN